MRIMYCYIEPWVVQQNVYLMDDGLKPVQLNKIDLENVANYLATSYNNHECNKIILHGSMPALTQQFADDIIQYGLTNFGLNDINIEVIK